MLITHWLYVLRRTSSNAAEGSRDSLGARLFESRKGLRPDEIAFRWKRRLTPAPVLAVARQKRLTRANRPQL